MALHHLPLINPSDYDAFRGILHGYIADTYDEWGDFHVNEAANLLRFGHTYDEIKVYPDEFADFLRRRGMHPSLKALENFAIEKAAGTHQK